MTKKNKISEFDFPEGRILAGKYQVLEKLGAGWEGEVYRVMELQTKIVRAAKIFFPHRNLKNKVAITYAKKLHKLSSCPIVIQYHTQEIFWHRGERVTCLISEFAEGDILSGYLKKQRGQRISIMGGIQLLHALAKGLEDMHRVGEYHGDIHTDNVIVKRYGLGFEAKLLDMYQWGDSKGANKAMDISNIIRIFYDAIGGKKAYARHPVEVKQICLGLRSDLIQKKFRTATQLRQYIENIEWHSSDRG